MTTAKAEETKRASEPTRQADKAPEPTAEPETVVAYSDPNDAEAAEKASRARSSTAKDSEAFRGADWAGLPRYECPHCGHSAVARTASPEDRETAKAALLEHVGQSHPQFIGQGGEA